jgi:hypothetical protein
LAPDFAAVFTSLLFGPGDFGAGLDCEEQVDGHVDRFFVAVVEQDVRRFNNLHLTTTAEEKLSAPVFTHTIDGGLLTRTDVRSVLAK